VFDCIVELRNTPDEEITYEKFTTAGLGDDF